MCFSFFEYEADVARLRHEIDIGIPLSMVEGPSLQYLLECTHDDMIGGIVILSRDHRPFVHDTIELLQLPSSVNMISVCESKKSIAKTQAASGEMHMSKLLNLERNLDLETKALVEQARSWGSQNLEPLIPKYWDTANFPPNIISSFRENCPNLLGYTLPKKYGGQGYSLLTSSHISRSLASIDASFTTTLLVQYGLCAESILLCGTEEQKYRLIPSLASLENMGCFCLTEPQSGSDASDLRTTATKVNGGYSISGSKRWIGNALTSEVFVVW